MVLLIPHNLTSPGAQSSGLFFKTLFTLGRYMNFTLFIATGLMMIGLVIYPIDAFSQGQAQKVGNVKNSAQEANLQDLQTKAQQGDPKSQYKLGLMYGDGQGVTKDDALAHKWLNAAADQGYPDALYALGVLNEMGMGIPQDQKKALSYLRKAADKNHRDAQYRLGGFYFSGSMTLPKDPKLALKWYRKAAENGHVESQAILGQM
jgi:TPR repeat protein